MKAYMGEEGSFSTPTSAISSSCSNMDGWNQLHDHQQHHEHFYRLTSSSTSSTEENMSISPSMIGTNVSSSPVAYHHGLNVSSTTTASHKFLEYPLENHQWSQILQCMEIDKSLRGIHQVESENFLGSLSYNHQAANTAYDHHHQMIECPRNYYDEKFFVSLTGTSDRVGSQKGVANSGYMRTSKPFTHFSQTSNMTSIDLTDPLFVGNQQEAQLSAKGGRIEGPVYNYYGKRKKLCDVPRDSHGKKTKQECPKASSMNKAQVNAPKAKLGDRISALQQIVSPFGKTDTASVLFEAFGYIKFLQEQVKLLSSPYLRSKDSTRGDMKLRNLGLCVVPISCTPQIYGENKGYSNPQHRGYSYQ